MRWRPAAAIAGAVAAVLVVAGAVAAVQARRGDHPTPALEVSGLPAPATGQRWVNWDDVAVQVPAGWGYGYEPDSQWCVDSHANKRDHAPYVSLDPSYGFHTEVGCTSTEHHNPAFGPAPEDRWADHVTLQSPQGPDGTWHDGPWTLTTRTVADVQIKALTRDPAVASSILDSARTITVDDAGCPVTSPIQTLDHVRPDAFDLASIDDVDAISICQYDRTIPASSPGLIASHLITDPAATDYLHALKTAPAGGGPDDPQDCSDDQDDGTGIVIRLWSGSTSQDLYAYYDWCSDNGIDDGTTRRALTHDTCAPLFTSPPVTLWAFQQDQGTRCTSPPAH